MLELIVTGQFKKEWRKMEKRGKDMEKLDTVIEMLCRGEVLPETYLDHPLHGESKGCRECHIEPDWLLKYKTDKKELVLGTLSTGSHSDLRFC